MKYTIKSTADKESLDVADAEIYGTAIECVKFISDLIYESNRSEEIKRLNALKQYLELRSDSLNEDQASSLLKEITGRDWNGRYYFIAREGGND